MHEDGERPRRLALGEETDAFAVDGALRPGEAVDLGELRGLGVLHMHPFGCNDEAHLLWTQSAWCGAFLVLVHSCSISLLTEASFFFIDGVVVSTASSSRWPFGSKK